MPGHVHMQEPTFAFLLNSGTICGQGIKQEQTHTTNVSVLVISCTRSITFYIFFYINPPKPLITVTHRPLFLNSNSHWCLHKDNGYVIFSSEVDTTLMLPLHNNLHDQTVTYCYSWIRLYMVHPVLKRQGQFLVSVSRRSAEIWRPFWLQNLLSATTTEGLIDSLIDSDSLHYWLLITDYSQDTIYSTSAWPDVICGSHVGVMHTAKPYGSGWWNPYWIRNRLISQGRERLPESTTLPQETQNSSWSCLFSVEICSIGSLECTEILLKGQIIQFLIVNTLNSTLRI